MSGASLLLKSRLVQKDWTTHSDAGRAAGRPKRHMRPETTPQKKGTGRAAFAAPPVFDVITGHRCCRDGGCRNTRYGYMRESVFLAGSSWVRLVLGLYPAQRVAASTAGLALGIHAV